jgi:tetratricopeptide (TPR) repeat protein
MAIENSNDPAMRGCDGELTNLLSRTSDPAQKLKRYAQYLPAMVGACPRLVIDHANDAERIARNLHPRNERIEANIRHWRGEAYLSFRKPGAALDDLGGAHASYCSLLPEKKHADLLDDCVALAMLAGKACMELRRYKDAIDWFNKALDHCKDKGTELEATAEETLGNAFSTMAQHSLALEHLHNALRIRERLGDVHTRGQSLHAIGRAYMRAEMHADAQHNLEQSIDVFRKKKKPYFEVQVVADLARVHQNLNDLPGALELALKAYESYQALGDLVNAAAIGATIGSIYEELEETETAFDVYLKAYRLLANHPDDAARLPILLNVGRMHKNRGDGDAAHLVFKWALEIATSLGDQRIIYQLHEALSSVLKLLGHFEHALHHHEQYVKIWQHVISEEQQREIARRQIDEDLKRAERGLNEAKIHAEQLERDRFEAASQLEQRNRAFSKLNEQIKQLGDPADDESAELLRKIIANIEQNRDSGIESKKLEYQFNERFPNFVRNLYRLCSTIARAELEVCYLAALGNNVKQISAIRGVGDRGTEKQIQLVRRKLGLRREDNFWNFMASLLKDPELDHTTDPENGGKPDDDNSPEDGTDPVRSPS